MAKNCKDYSSLAVEASSDGMGSMGGIKSPPQFSPHISTTSSGPEMPHSSSISLSVSSSLPLEFLERQSRSGVVIRYEGVGFRVTDPVRGDEALAGAGLATGGDEGGVGMLMKEMRVMAFVVLRIERMEGAV